MPNASKFLSHRYSFIQVDDLSDWRQSLGQALGLAKGDPEAVLSECRGVNAAFHQAVLNLAET
ncbi:hypothetical protein IP76_07855 [Rhizobium sp. AAP43]|nr:hypothetical protein IP76_07855 [Rhizobium sp. AAP43]